MFILLGSKTCILNSFGLLLETPRRRKLPNVPSEILLTIKLHLFNLFHFLHLLGSTCSQPGRYAFVWPEFSAPLGLKIFHVHTFSFGLLLETPRRGKLPNVPSEILLTIKLHLIDSIFSTLLAQLAASQAPEHKS